MSCTEAVAPAVLCKKGVLRSFTKFTGKHLWACNFIKKETLAQVFPCEFTKFLSTPFLQNSCRRLFLRDTTTNTSSLNFAYDVNIINCVSKLFWVATSKTWTRTLTRTLKNLDPEKPGSWKSWTLKNLE